MGAGGSNFIHNAYDFYQKPEIQIPLQTAKLIYNTYELVKIATHKHCIGCGKYYTGFDDDYYCPRCWDNINSYN